MKKQAMDIWGEHCREALEKCRVPKTEVCTTYLRIGQKTDVTRAVSMRI